MRISFVKAIKFSLLLFLLSCTNEYIEHDSEEGGLLECIIETFVSLDHGFDVDQYCIVITQERRPDVQHDLISVRKVHLSSSNSNLKHYRTVINEVVVYLYLLDYSSDHAIKGRSMDNTTVSNSLSWQEHDTKPEMKPTEFDERTIVYDEFFYVYFFYNIEEECLDDSQVLTTTGIEETVHQVCGKCDCK